jgi:ribosomal protein L11 methyltransferase
MRNYKLVQLTNTNGNNELLIAFLDQLSFDSFEELDENSLNAYILKEEFNQDALSQVINELEQFKSVKFEVSDLENKNWNQEWEKNFLAIQIGNECVVRAPFHDAVSVPYELVIEPKMAFGTGHHATTEMVLTLMLRMDFNNKEVLDFGCGTGILSLLAEKMGAKSIQANDIEEPAFINTIENAQLNGCSKITAIHGAIDKVPVQNYDVILANVTTNTIKENLAQLLTLLSSKGGILLSGILLEQEDEVKDLAKSLQLSFVGRKNQDNWVALQYSKP